MPSSQSYLPWQGMSAFFVMWFRNKTILVASSLTILIVIAVLMVVHIGSPRIVASAVAPDGTEFCIVQRCNWSAEPFTTSCYYRKPGGRWGWFYYDHEDWYWDKGHVEVDLAAKRIGVYRRGLVTVTFDWESETFQLLRPDFPHRKQVGTGTFMPEGWSPR
jgi:hypothetical protein